MGWRGASGFDMRKVSSGAALKPQASSSDRTTPVLCKTPHRSSHPPLLISGADAAADRQPACGAIMILECQEGEKKISSLLKISLTSHHY